ALNVAARAHDGPCAEKADARDDLGGHPARVAAEPQGHGREQGRANRDQRVGAQAGLLAAPLALEAEHRSQHARQQYAAGQGQDVVFRYRQLCHSGTSLAQTPTGGTLMLWTIIFILLVRWLLGFALDVPGGLIHLLLVVALVVIVFRLLSGRKVV